MCKWLSCVWAIGNAHLLLSTTKFAVAGALGFQKHFVRVKREWLTDNYMDMSRWEIWDIKWMKGGLLLSFIKGSWKGNKKEVVFWFCLIPIDWCLWWLYDLIHYNAVLVLTRYAHSSLIIRSIKQWECLETIYVRSCK